MYVENIWGIFFCMYIPMVIVTILAYLEGREEGRVEEKLAIARGMKSDGLSVETIAKYTGLSAEEIENL